MKTYPLNTGKLSYIIDTADHFTTIVISSDANSDRSRRCKNGYRLQAILNQTIDNENWLPTFFTHQTIGEIGDKPSKLVVPPYQDSNCQILSIDFWHCQLGDCKGLRANFGPMFHIVYSSNLSHHGILFMPLALAPIVWLIVGLQAASIFMSDTKYTSSGVVGMRITRFGRRVSPEV